MIAIYQQCVKTNVFPSLSIYFFSHFFLSPNSNFGEPWEKMGIFSILKIETLFPSLFIYFFSIPKSKFRCVLGKNVVGPPPLFFVKLTPTMHVTSIWHLTLISLSV